MSAVLVANPDGFPATRTLHSKLARALPKDTQMVVLQSEGHSDSREGPAPKGCLALKAGVDSPWARDFAPTFVRNREGQLEIVDFNYGYDGADGVAQSLAKKLGLPVRTCPLTLEVGNLVADGGRVFLTTKVLARNKGLSQEQVEAELKKALCVDEVVWMKRLPEEPTGHLDMYAKLVGPRTMLVSDTPHPLQGPVMDEAAQRFERLGYTVVRVTNPAFKPKDPDVTQWGATRSYANAFIVNGTAFVPQYRSEVDKVLGYEQQVTALDQAALQAYARAGFKAVGVSAAHLINFQGSVHCMTNTLPAEVDPQRLVR